MWKKLKIVLESSIVNKYFLNGDQDMSLECIYA